MQQDFAILRAFQTNGRRLLTEQTTRFLAQAMLGQTPQPGFREQLGLALARLASPDCILQVSEQVEVATFFLPQVQELAQQQQLIAPALDFTAEFTSISGPVRLAAAVGVGSKTLDSLRLYYNGDLLASTGAATISSLHTPAAIILGYRAVAQFSDGTSLQKDVLLTRRSQWLYGMGSAAPSGAELSLLQTVDGSDNLQLTFVSPERRNMLVWVGEGQSIKAIHNPDLGQTNLLTTFASAPATVPGYGAGTAYWSRQRIITTGYPLTFYLNERTAGLPTAIVPLQIKAVFPAGMQQAQTFTINSLSEQGTYVFPLQNALVDIVPGSVVFTLTRPGVGTMPVDITTVNSVTLRLDDSLTVSAQVSNGALFGLLTLIRIENQATI